MNGRAHNGAATASPSAMTPRLPPRGLLGTRRRRSAEPNTEGGQVDEHGPGDDPDEHADGGCQQGERVAVRVAERVGGVEVLHGLGHDGAARVAKGHHRREGGAQAWGGGGSGAGCQCRGGGRGQTRWRGAVVSVVGVRDGGGAWTPHGGNGAARMLRLGHGGLSMAGGATSWVQNGLCLVQPDPSGWVRVQGG